MSMIHYILLSDKWVVIKSYLQIVYTRILNHNFSYIETE